MSSEKNKNNPVQTGNASNPSPEPMDDQGKQLLNKKAEKYLREGGNIEDLPDPQEQQEAEELIRKEAKK